MVRKPKKSAGPSRKPSSKPSRVPGAGLKTRWSGLRPLYDYWGNEIPRFYKLETLANATDKLIHSRDTFIVPSIKQVLGPSPVLSLHFELFQEGQFAVIFKVSATNAKRKRASFAFVVAKNSDELTKVTAREHAFLQVLHGRSPEHVVKPFQGGRIYLPDRHGRKEHGREVYAYLTQWLGMYHELGVSKTYQFFINVVRPQMLTVAQTEQLKAKMVEIIASTYDPQKRECMDMPQIASGDFVVTKPARGPLRLKLIACRRMLKLIRPAKLIHTIVGANWKWGDSRFYLAPADPGETIKALQRAWGKEKSRWWLEEYRKAVAGGKLSRQPALPLEALGEPTAE